jgi:hypothetical protein
MGAQDPSRTSERGNHDSFGILQLLLDDIEGLPSMGRLADWLTGSRRTARGFPEVFGRRGSNRIALELIEEMTEVARLTLGIDLLRRASSRNHATTSLPYRESGRK